MQRKEQRRTIGESQARVAEDLNKARTTGPGATPAVGNEGSTGAAVGNETPAAWIGAGPSEDNGAVGVATDGEAPCRVARLEARSVVEAGTGGEATCRAAGLGEK